MALCTSPPQRFFPRNIAYGQCHVVAWLCLGAHALLGQGIELDYIEIGSQTFDTLSEERRGSGISVDLISEYVDVLRNRTPTVSGKIYVNAAIVGSPGHGSVSIYRVNPRYVEDGYFCRSRASSECGCNAWHSQVKRDLADMGITVLTQSMCIPWWALAMSSVNASWFSWLPVMPVERVHALLERRLVPSLTPRELLMKFRVSNALHLKIDAEGHDAQILDGFARVMASWRSFRPLQISWECKALTKFEVRSSMVKLARFGYSCKAFDHKHHQNLFRSTSWYENCGCALDGSQLRWPMHVETEAPHRV